MYASYPEVNVLVTSFKKCECDQFKHLWHSRITNDNNVMYQLFKISHCKDLYIEILPEHLKLLPPLIRVKIVCS